MPRWRLLIFYREAAALPDQEHFQVTHDVGTVAALRAAAEGGDPASKQTSVDRHMKQGKVYALAAEGGLIATFCLTPKKPWAIDASLFTPVDCALYLVAMAVAPDHQRRGLGTRCLVEAEAIATTWPAGAIRLDAYDRPGGAGPFYECHGYRQVGRVVYRGTPLIYYERLLRDHAAR